MCSCVSVRERDLFSENRSRFFSLFLLFRICWEGVGGYYFHWGDARRFGAAFNPKVFCAVYQGGCSSVGLFLRGREFVAGTLFFFSAAPGGARR